MDFLCAGLLLVSFLPLTVISTTLKLDRAFPLERSLSEVIHQDQMRLQNTGIIDYELHGSAHLDYYGIYYTKVLIASPRREFNLMIDTGSHITWVSCIPCDGCPKYNKFGIQLQQYDPQNSTSSLLISCTNKMCSTKSRCTDNLCDYEIHYGGGSATKGIMVSDTFHFETTRGGSARAYASTSMIFGCSNYISGGWATSDSTVDGIFALGYKNLSIISQLSLQDIFPGVFSHCLRGDYGGGILLFGEILEPGIVYTPLVPSKGQYNVNLQSIAINGKPIPIDAAVFAAESGTIVDSGTTLVYLAEKAYVSVINHLITSVWHSARPVVLFGSVHCFEVSNGIDEIFPPISFHFMGGASIILKPEDYLIPNSRVRIMLRHGASDSGEATI